MNKIPTYSSRLTVLLFLFCFWEANAVEPLIEPDEGDTLYIIKAEDIDYIGCRMCDFIAQVDEDIDGDGFNEHILITNHSSGLGINFVKRDKNDDILFSDYLELELHDSGYHSDYKDITLILHDFNKDGIPELVISYYDEGICGKVYKLNGVGLDLKKIHDMISTSNLKINNFIEEIGYFDNGWSNCYIRDDYIFIRESPTLNEWVEYLYHNNRLYKSN